MKSQANTVGSMLELQKKYATRLRYAIGIILEKFVRLDFIDFIDYFIHFRVPSKHTRHFIQQHSRKPRRLMRRRALRPQKTNSRQQLPNCRILWAITGQNLTKPKLLISPRS